MSDSHPRRRATRSARIHPDRLQNGDLSARRASEWSGTSLRLLQHAVLSSTVLWQHAQYWGKVHSTVHAITATCVFLTVLISIAKDELPEEEEDAAALLTTLAAALPFAASIMLVVSASVGPRRKWATLQLASHRCEAELWAYRSRAGPYDASDASMDDHLVLVLQEIWEDLLPARAMRVPLHRLSAATLGGHHASCLAGTLAWVGVGQDVTVTFGSEWLKMLVARSSYRAPSPHHQHQSSCLEAPTLCTSSSAPTGDLVVADLTGMEPNPPASAPTEAPAPAAAPPAPAAAAELQPGSASESCAPMAGFGVVEVKPTRRTVEQIELDGKVGCAALPLDAIASCEAAQRTPTPRPPQRRGMSGRSTSSRLVGHGHHFARDDLAPLTTQRYLELRLRPTAEARAAEARRRLRRLHRVQAAILACTLASCALALLSLAEQQLDGSALALPDELRDVARRATRYVPVVLAAAAAFASFIEAEQMALRARGADASAHALERLDRWFEGLGPGVPEGRDNGADTVRTMLVQQAEQALRDEVAACVDMSSDRRAVFDKRARAVAMSKLGRRGLIKRSSS